MSNISSTYNNGTLFLDMTSNVTYDKGLFLGNGKIGMYTSNCLDASQTFITSSVRPGQGTIETFNPFKITLDTSSNLAQTSQSLDMNSGIFNTCHTSTYSNTTLSVSSDMYAVRNLPFTSIQTVKITPSNNVNSIQMHHYLSAKTNIINPDYNNNVIYDNIGDAPVYILTGKGTTLAGTEIVCASTYIFEGTSANRGFNILTNDLSTCFNLFTLSNLTANTIYRFHVITTYMTSDDFDNPLEECKRICLNIVNRGITKVRTEHVRQWMLLWDASDVTIIPKLGITLEEGQKIDHVNRFLKSSLYNIYSCTRGGLNLDINNTNLGFIDLNGDGLYTGELSLIPMLILLKPEFARSLLDYRYKTISTAIQLAAGYGYRGAKFPYQDDRIGYKNSLYWTTTSSITIFNTAMISINIWNYYRIVQDQEWLRSIGHPVLKANAEFFISLIEGYSPDPLQCNCYGATSPDLSINNVIGLCGIFSSNNNAFTNNLVKTALRYAIESGYESSTGTPTVWTEYYQYLPIPMDYNIVKLDDTADSTIYNILPIPEPLTLFIPSYSEEMTRHYQTVLDTSYSAAIGSNMNVYLAGSNFASPDGSIKVVANGGSNVGGYINTNPISNFISGTLNGIYAQTNGMYIDTFESSIDTFLTNNIKAGSTWGSFDDISISSLYVMMIIQGICQTAANGGVSSARFYYNELGLTSLVSANMPKTWKTIRIKSNTATYFTQNIMSYP